MKFYQGTKSKLSKLLLVSGLALSTAGCSNVTLNKEKTDEKTVETDKKTGGYESIAVDYLKGIDDAKRGTKNEENTISYDYSGGWEDGAMSIYIASNESNAFDEEVSQNCLKVFAKYSAAEAAVNLYYQFPTTERVIPKPDMEELNKQLEQAGLDKNKYSEIGEIYSNTFSNTYNTEKENGKYRSFGEETDFQDFMDGYSGKEIDPNRERTTMYETGKQVFDDTSSVVKDKTSKTFDVVASKLAYLTACMKSRRDVYTKNEEEIKQAKELGSLNENDILEKYPECPSVALNFERIYRSRYHFYLQDKKHAQPGYTSDVDEAESTKTR